MSSSLSELYTERLITCSPFVTNTIDTQHLHKALQYAKEREPSRLEGPDLHVTSLEKLVAECGLPAEDLHNAGIDARRAMQAMITFAVRSAEQRDMKDPLQILDGGSLCKFANKEVMHWERSETTRCVPSCSLVP